MQTKAELWKSQFALLRLDPLNCSVFKDKAGSFQVYPGFVSLWSYLIILQKIPLFSIKRKHQTIKKIKEIREGANFRLLMEMRNSTQL